MFCLVLAAFFVITAFAVDADAARLGGGRSFGGKSTYTRPAPAPQPSRQAPGNQAYSRQQNPAQTQAAPGAGMARPGMGGMLGGLLAGTLIGSLLFGGGFGGFGMMDILLFALVAFLGLKLLRAFMGRREAPVGAGGEARGGTGSYARTGDAPSGGPANGPANGPAGNDPWQRLRDQTTADSASPAAQAAGAAPVSGAPAGFDQDDFLRGAKVLFARLQESWDKRDIDDIATFTTAGILNEVREQARADPGPSRTEIVFINASMVSFERDGDDDVATVFFDVLVRENPEADAPSQVRELWHFVRPSGSSQSWRLDGIQQVS